MKRQRIITNDKVVVRLAELNGIHYNKAAEFYNLAKKHCKVFTNDTVTNHVKYLVNKSRNKAKNPFAKNVS